MIPSRFVIPLVVGFLLHRAAAEDALPTACNNCTICPYPCHTLPVAPPPPAELGYPVYGEPPPPAQQSPAAGMPGQGNCPPGQVVSCCPSTTPTPPSYPYGYGGYAPPTPPLGYQPYQNRSPLTTFPSVHFGLAMLMLLLILFIGI